VFSVVAVFVMPVVLAYQAWTYHVLRRRLEGAAAALPPAHPNP
jgi:cytochrome bd-type quinol oxidase subunit 2